MALGETEALPSAEGQALRLKIWNEMAGFYHRLFPAAEQPDATMKQFKRVMDDSLGHEVLSGISSLN